MLNTAVKFAFMAHFLMFDFQCLALLQLQAE